MMEHKAKAGRLGVVTDQAEKLPYSIERTHRSKI
jgi:hypothetical protein